jgi:hypothetical protein
MVFELVKNSLRAVQERFMDSDKDVPPVRIIVADGIEDVTIKVCNYVSVVCAGTNLFWLYIQHSGTSLSLHVVTFLCSVPFSVFI